MGFLLGFCLVIKPGLAGQPGTRSLDRSGFNKRPVGTITRQQPGRPERTQMRPGVFFFQIWDFKPISIYIICSQENVFSMWDKKLFGLNIST
jgi:hypothetical protein